MACTVARRRRPLDAAAGALHARIDADPEGHDRRTWRHDHVEEFMRQRPWLLACADLVVDTGVTDAVGTAPVVVDAI